MCDKEVHLLVIRT